MNFLKNLFKSKTKKASQEEDIFGTQNWEETQKEYEEQEERERQAAMVDGKPYYEHDEYAKELVREKRHDEAIALYLKIIEAAEKEAIVSKNIIPPSSYYMKLAIIYRKEKRYDDEVVILERCRDKCGLFTEVKERLEKAEELKNKKNKKSIEADEINRKYHQADSKRWMQQDFVLGVEVKRSKNHSDCDICEAGAGKYPKDYMWDVWHSGCKCYAVPILASDDEMDKFMDAQFDGKEYKFKGQITEFPKKMRDFMNKAGFKHIGHENYFDT